MSDDDQGVVLIVDDETSIREFVSTVLREEGFLTMSACSVSEASALCRARTDHIHVIVTDVGLEDGDGIALAERIRQARQGIAVVVMSGVPDNRHRAATNGYTFLEKPFQAVILLNAVRRAMRRPDSK